ncbi:SRPBCC domain-containing protein [Paenibacillus alba]|uniref:SRPBCC domain-containing protein n=1 Tax=Paenibacillus alba TaxID=1197127 RepID=A0ABU6GB75_9BACL|nr:SRPBCC domain-containing protein [Paenibacillus alba]MEC0231442.1 SRPBCC domain-containing protein [Paenibacillus alba]
MSTQRVVGQTAAAGFQIGVRRTLSLPQEEAWALLLSPQGRKLWLGEITNVEFSKGSTFETVEGHCGEFRVVKPLEQLRLIWQPAGWLDASTLQIRLLPTAHAGKTTISFHQEKLDNAERREVMKTHWEDVIAGLQAMADNGFTS